jgi:WhiB family transcriptional regulator, redox-sensing transcriptional regulator
MSVSSVAAPAGKRAHEWNSGDWRRRAACSSSDPDLFFPIGDTGPAVEHAEAAKAVCRQCPVRLDCLEYALTSNQDAGVWGGATEEERRKLRRQRRFAGERPRS